MNCIGLYGLLLLLHLLLLFNNGAPQAIIKSLPGYSGPCRFGVETFDGSLPSIILNPYSWTKVANIIFIDAPVGTGFSYANTSQGYSSSDIKSAKDIFTFLRKWLLNHPIFIKNRLYISGESYGGKLVPLVAMEILRGNKARLQPQMSFQGYIIGNGLTDPNIDFNARIPYVHRMTLISDEYFENLDYTISENWANDPIVQEALYIRKGTIARWRMCNDGISYEPNVESALKYHKILIKKGYHVLVFNGDHDMAAPYMGPLKWIRILNLTIDDNWRPWLVNGQVAGYTEKYKKNDFDLTFGAGHSAPKDKPEECLAMFHRWLSRRPL
ncbi:unnamed protein product [Fraxinus pennsylvanica]|uniref:Carboxypeptidase n=1 Tax=Fraxinus pennsylvanica TaxID=56036 RepID=A0AAD2EET1_9LAMI|nr:unnamed protein product [Fraxinus pennsylvanica]